MLTLTAVSLVFVAIGFAIREREPWAAYSCMAFFGLCALVGAINLHPQSSYLEVTAEGFAFTSLFRRTFVAWENVEHFFPVTIARNGMVGWDYKPAYAGQAVGRKISSALADVEAALPDTYGLPAAELSAILNKHLTVQRGEA